MRTLKRCAMASLALAALVNGAAWALPTVAQADNLARSALALNQYAEVVKVYGDQKPDDLGALSYYRLAIAHQKLGDGAAASVALDKALALNPKGTFASSPDRLSRLQSDIAKGSVGNNPALPEPKEAVPTAPAPASSASSPMSGGEAISATEKPALVVDPIVEPTPGSEPMPSSTQAATAVSVPAMQATPVARIESAPNQTLNPVGYTMSFFAGLIALTAIALNLHLAMRNRVTRKESKRYEDELAKALENLAAAAKAESIRKVEPVSDVGDLVALRNEVTKVRELIEQAGSTESMLSKALVKLEPLLAMEIGRNHFRLNRDASALVHADQQMLATVANLEQAPLSLDGTDPEEVMRYFRGGGDRFTQTLDVPIRSKMVA